MTTLYTRVGIADLTRIEQSEDASWGIVPFVISNDRRDDYATRIAQDFFRDGRDFRWRTNPVMPWHHSRDGKVLPIGRWDYRAETPEYHTVTLDDGSLATRMDGWFDLADEFAAAVYGKFKRRVLSACSIGFKHGTARPISSLREDHPWYNRADTSGIALEGNTLLECSPVIVGGNEGTLAQRDSGWLAAALVEQAPDVVRAELVRLLREDQSVRAMLREIEGDTYDDGLTVAIPAAREALPVDPWAWLAGKK